MHTNLIYAISNYNKTHKPTLNLTDAFILSTLHSTPYHSDSDLASKALCSERTIKRSINKLCECGLLEKHLAYDNTKSVNIKEDVYNNLLAQHFTKDI